MILHDIQIRSFGRLHHFSLQPTEGFQLIYGTNEQGKSTLMAFIRAMLYGFASDGRKLETKERQRYRPWDGGDMGGVLVFSHQGRRLRLERHFGQRKAADRTVLMDDISGEVMAARHEDMPGFDVLGISEQEFTDTVFVRQMGSIVGENGDLLTRLSNLAGSDSPQTSVADVAQRLRQAEADLQSLRGNSGRIPALEFDLADLREQREKAVQTAEQLAAQQQHLQQLQKSRQELTDRMKMLRGDIEQQTVLRRLERWRQIKKARDQLQQLEEDRANIIASLTVADHLITDQDLDSLEHLRTVWLEARQQRDIRQKQMDQLQQTLAAHEAQQPDASLNRLDRTKLREQRQQADQIGRQTEQAAYALSQAEALAEASRENRRELQDRSHARQRLEAQHNEDLRRLNEDKTMALRELSEHKAEREELKQRLERSQTRLSELTTVLANGAGAGQTKPRWTLFLTSLILALAFVGLTFYLRQPLIGLAAPLMVLPAVILMLRQRQQFNRQRQAVLQDRAVLESELNRQQSQLEASQRLASSAERMVRDLDHRIQDESIRFAEQLESHDSTSRTSEARLADTQNRLARQIDELNTILPVSSASAKSAAGLTDDASIAYQLETLRHRLRQQREAAEQQQAVLNRTLTEAGCTNWSQFEDLLQSIDQYQGELGGIQQQIQQAEPLLAEAESASTQAAESLLDAFHTFHLELTNPAQTGDSLRAMRDGRQQLQAIDARVAPAQQYFNQLLDQKSYDAWLDFSRSATVESHLERLPDETMAEMEQSLENMSNERMALQSEFSSLETEIRQTSRQLISVRELDDQIIRKNEKLTEMQRYVNWLRQARQALDQAADELQKSFGPDLNHQTGEILSQLTRGQYDDIKIDRTFAIRFADHHHRFHEWPYLSGGTADQVYLALRLAIADQITDPAHPLPLLLDDILIQYDDQRAGAALSMLMSRSVERGQQILFLTCQSRFHEQAQHENQSIFTINS